MDAFERFFFVVQKFPHPHCYLCHRSFVVGNRKIRIRLFAFTERPHRKKKKKKKKREEKGLLRDTQKHNRSGGTRKRKSNKKKPLLGGGLAHQLFVGHEILLVRAFVLSLVLVAQRLPLLACVHTYAYKWRGTRWFSH